MISPVGQAIGENDEGGRSGNSAIRGRSFVKCVLGVTRYINRRYEKWCTTSGDAYDHMGDKTL